MLEFESDSDSEFVRLQELRIGEGAFARFVVVTCTARRSGLLYCSEITRKMRAQLTIAAREDACLPVQCWI